MKNFTRRAIAYVAGCLISGNQSSAVYDYSLSTHSQFSGEVSDSALSVYDYGEKCHINGSGGADSFSLLHYENKKHLSLQVDGVFSTFESN